MLKNNRQAGFVLAEGMVSVLIIASFSVWQSISLFQNIAKLDETKLKLENQRQLTNREFTVWQEKKHSP